MKIFSYVEFITEEAGIKGLFKLSREVKYNLEKLIRQFNDPVASALLELDRSQQYITYVNLTDKPDKVSYLDVSRVNSIFRDIIELQNNQRGDKELSLEDYIKVYTLKHEPSSLSTVLLGKKISFTEISIGRFAKKILLDTFSDHEISTFVERWTSLSTKADFEIWNTDKIIVAYSSENYEEYMGSSLSNSCMNDETSPYFYKLCPTAKILVLLDDDGSKSKAIKGRCLLWVDVDGRKIMDRIYYNSESDYYNFIKWGNDNGYYIRNTKAGKLTTFLYKGEEVKLKTKVKFPDFDNIPKHYNEFPFIDTFCYVKDGFGMNYQPEEPGKYYKLQETDGTFEEYYNMDPSQRDMSDNENW